MTPVSPSGANPPPNPYLPKAPPIPPNFEDLAHERAKRKAERAAKEAFENTGSTPAPPPPPYTPSAAEEDLRNIGSQRKPPPNTPRTPPPKPITFYGRLCKLLEDINKKTIECPLKDDTTNLLRDWVRTFMKFTNTLEKKPEQEVKTVTKEFIKKLQRILRDPISKAPLGAAALLGNDEHTYDYKSLLIYLSLKPEEYRNQSPMDPTKTPFYVTKHPLIPIMIHFLRSYKSLLVSEEVNKKFEELEKSDNLPKVPWDPEESEINIDEVIRKQEEREKNAFNPEFLAKEKAKMEEVKKEYEEEKKKTKAAEDDIDERLKKMQEDFTEIKNDLEQQKEGLEEEARKIDEELKDIAAESQWAKEMGENLQKQNDELRQSAAELNKAINKKEDDDNKALVRTIAICVIAAIATYGISQMMAPAAPAVLPAAETAGAGGGAVVASGGAAPAMTLPTVSTSTAQSFTTSAAANPSYGGNIQFKMSWPIEFLK